MNTLPVGTRRNNNVKNNVATSFWRNNAVIIASCARWGLLTLWHAMNQCDVEGINIHKIKLVVFDLSTSKCHRNPPGCAVNIVEFIMCIETEPPNVEKVFHSRKISATSLKSWQWHSNARNKSTLPQISSTLFYTRLLYRIASCRIVGKAHRCTHHQHQQFIKEEDFRGFENEWFWELNL